jgi:hypothetical protein
MFFPFKQSIRNRFLKIFENEIENTIANYWTKRRPIDYERVAYCIAAVESAKYFQTSMRMAPNLITNEKLLIHALEHVTNNGLWLEFGVYKGYSLKIIAEKTKRKVFGFDSFEGLPEDWTHFQKKGRYSLNGLPPGEFSENVILVKGLFSNTLPVFVKNQKDSISFLHIDSDLYSSAKIILKYLNKQILKNTIIVFDDFINYPGWQFGEFKAFNEFVKQNRIQFDFLGFASSRHSVAVRILNRQ